MKSSYFQEIQPERDITGDNFSKGEINFNFTMDSTGYFNPYKSFLKLRFKLLKSTGPEVSLVVADDVAPNMLLCDNLFQQIKMHINNQCISEIQDYVPQVASLKNRMYKSEEHMNNYLADTNFSQAYAVERQAQVVSDPASFTDSAIQILNNVQVGRDRRTFEAIWHLPLGFWDIDEFIPGCQGLFNLRLTPHPGTIFKRCAVEALTTTKVPDTDYVFSVESMNLYLLKGIGAPVVNKAINLQMREIRCQSQNLTTNSLHQKTFQIHPNTQELTLAYQFAGASITDNLFSASKFVCDDGDELKIRRFWINYGGKQLPSPIPDTEFNDTTKLDYLTQRYVESIMYANALHSPEPLRKWLERGIYFHFSGYSAEEKEDRCFVSSQFDAFGGASNPNVLLFDHYIKKVAIHIENSRIQNVQSY